jgi:hypothetical protein
LRRMGFESARTSTRGYHDVRDCHDWRRATTSPGQSWRMQRMHSCCKTRSPKRRRAGPSSRKRKQARAANEVSAAVNNNESVNEIVNAAPDDNGGANLLTPEVSDDKGGVEEDDDSSAESVTPQLNPKPQPLASAKGETGSNDGLYNDDEDDMEALGSLNRDPHLVGLIFARRAADERLAGLDVAANVWSTTKQLLGDSSAAQKLAWATATSKERAYLMVMGGNKYFTLIHHLTIMDVELRPKDPIKGQLVAFEAKMRDDDAPPGRWYSVGPPRTFSGCSTPN